MIDIFWFQYDCIYYFSTQTKYFIETILDNQNRRNQDKRIFVTFMNRVGTLSTSNYRTLRYIDQRLRTHGCSRRILIYNLSSAKKFYCYRAFRPET